MFNFGLFFFVCVFVHPVLLQNRENNACYSWEGYWHTDGNPDCFYTPNIYMEPPDLIKTYFGYYEVYEIETDDGYFVTTYRIPRKNRKGVILFRHPASSDSIAYVGTGNESIAYYFWSKGYELWLTNNRGTPYSFKHVRLTPNDYEYWNFGMEEIALLDLPSALKYIHNFYNGTTKISIIAHSMGSTEALIFASLLPQVSNQYVNIYLLLSPTMSFTGSPSNAEVYSGLITKYLGPLDKRDRFGGFLMANTTLTGIIRTFCTGANVRICHIVSGTTAGWTDRFDPKLASTAFAQNPRGVSVKAILHYGQIMGSGRFQRFDYGEDNKKIYGADVPPLFPVRKITTPTFLVYSEADLLAPAEDIEYYYKKMSKRAKKYGKLKVPNLNHLDPLFGLDRYNIYEKLLPLLEEVNKPNKR